MDRERPPFVKRYSAAFGTPAMTRWQTSEAHRKLAKERSMMRINDPIEADLPQVSVSREFDFLRDFWNQFHECMQACQALDLVHDLASQSMSAVDAARHTSTVTFWVESYLNEAYIFQCRILDLIKFIQRRYKKDVDFTDFVIPVGDSLAEFVIEQLSPFIEVRGTHVHQRRHRVSDPMVVRQNLLDTMIDILGHSELEDKRKEARKETASWLDRQLDLAANLAWHLLNEVCRGFADGILLDNDRIIVPTHLKDNPQSH